MDLKGKSVFITGVSSGGLGHGFASTVLESGGAVYAIGRTEPEDLRDNANFHFQECDLRDFSSITPALDSLLEGSANLDLVVLNAGIKGVVNSLQETPLSVIEEVMTVNVFANKVIMDHLLKSEHKLEQVVGISSGAAVNGSAGMGAYSISKASLNLLLRVYSSENPDIHFSSIAPGLVQTRMMDQLVSTPDERAFPAIRTMQSKMGTSAMQNPANAAKRVLSALEAVKQEKSGAFVDVRDLDWGRDVNLSP